MASLDEISRRFDALRSGRQEVTRKRVAEARELCRGELVEAAQECTTARETVKAGCREREGATRKAVTEEFRPAVLELARERRELQPPPERRPRAWTWREAWEDESAFREGQRAAEDAGAASWFNAQNRGRAMYSAWRKRTPEEKRTLPFHDEISNRLADAGWNSYEAAPEDWGRRTGGEAMVEMSDLAERRGDAEVRARARQEREEWAETVRLARTALRARWATAGDAARAASAAIESLQHVPAIAGRVVRCEACHRAGEVVRSPRGYVFGHPSSLERLCKVVREETLDGEEDDLDEDLDAEAPF